MQTNVKQEKEQLKRALDLCSKEKEMYKKDRENLNKDNQRLRKNLQDLIGQNNILKRQVEILEQHEDVSNDQKADSIKEQLDYEIQKLRKDLLIECDKTKKWELFCSELKQSKEKADSERNSILSELNKLRSHVNELTQKNATILNEKDEVHRKMKHYETELSQLKSVKQEERKIEVERSDVYIENKNPVFDMHNYYDQQQEKDRCEENEHGSMEKAAKYEEDEFSYQEQPIEEEQTQEEHNYEVIEEPQEADEAEQNEGKI